MKIKFEIGDRVTIIGNINKERDPYNDYTYLDQFIGKTATIIKFNCLNSHGEDCWYLDINYGGKPLTICERNLDMA
jgi:hypothetical protein